MGAVLYSFRRCPYAMRARMALHVSELDYEHREVSLRNKPEAMLTASPKGTVPVFITESGRVIDESLDLAQYALGRADPQGWLEGYEPDVVATIDGDFKHHLDRYKYKSRYDDNAKRGDVDLTHRAKAVEILLPLNARLSKTAFLSGQRQSLTDIATFPFIRQFAAVEPEWWSAHDMPYLRKWLHDHVTSELFKAVMVKHPLWQDETTAP